MLALSQLEKIDRQLQNILFQDAVNVEEIDRLLTERKQCLVDISMHVDKLEKESWLIAINRTKQIYSQIKKHRDSAAAEAERLLKGRKSIQIYKKFE